MDCSALELGPRTVRKKKDQFVFPSEDIIVEQFNKLFILKSVFLKQELVAIFLVG